MMKEVVRSLETGFLAEVGLIAFVLAFTLIVYRVLKMKKSDRDNAKNLPLEEPEEITRFTNGNTASQQ